MSGVDEAEIARAQKGPATVGRRCGERLGAQLGTSPVAQCDVGPRTQSSPMVSSGSATAVSGATTTTSASASTSPQLTSVRVLSDAVYPQLNAGGLERRAIDHDVARRFSSVDRP